MAVWVNNPAIGTIACPIPGCEQTAAVCQFRSAHQRDSGRRMGGKLYAKCPRHGRIGADAGEAMQDWILKNAHMYSPAERHELSAGQAKELDAEPLLPVPAAAAEPVAEPVAEPAPAKKGGFGFFS